MKVRIATRVALRAAAFVGVLVTIAATPKSVIAQSGFKACNASCASDLATCIQPIEQTLQECLTTCTEQASSDLAACTTRIDPGSCNQEAKRGAKACQAACRTVALPARAECRAARTSCQDGCRVLLTAFQQCRSRCVSDTQACIRTANDTFETCRIPCDLDLGTKLAACDTQPRPKACKKAANQDFVACMRPCRQDLKADGLECQATSAECKAGC